MFLITCVKKNCTVQPLLPRFHNENWSIFCRLLAARPKLKFDDSWKKESLDDVYVAKFFKSVVYPFKEAVECHKETHHPDIYNVPNAPLHVRIELNMQGEKKTRFLDDFTKMAAIPHRFDHVGFECCSIFGLYFKCYWVKVY